MRIDQRIQSITAQIDMLNQARRSIRDQRYPAVCAALTEAAVRLNTGIAHWACIELKTRIRKSLGGSRYVTGWLMQKHSFKFEMTDGSVEYVMKRKGASATPIEYRIMWINHMIAEHTEVLKKLINKQAKAQV